MAKFAANHVHQKLVLSEDYREKRYGAALKRAFLATDEDLLMSKFECYNGIKSSHFLTDPDHTKATSGGSTALAALVTECGQIYVVRNYSLLIINSYHNNILLFHPIRLMRVTPDVPLVRGVKKNN